jgi:hypothetical protein
LASPLGQLSSHPAAGLLSLIGLACGFVGFVRWTAGSSGWGTFLGIAAILWANSLVGAAIQMMFDGCEALSCQHQHQPSTYSAQVPTQHLSLRRFSAAPGRQGIHSR